MSEGLPRHPGAVNSPVCLRVTGFFASRPFASVFLKGGQDASTVMARHQVALGIFFETPLPNSPGVVIQDTGKAAGTVRELCGLDPICAIHQAHGLVVQQSAQSHFRSHRQFRRLARKDFRRRVSA
jgi:hypothetical protein